MIFHDRLEAGKQLADALKKMDRSNPLVLALPRGGVGVAQPVAKALGVKLEVIFVRKLGAEFNPELGVGAIVEGNPPQTFLNEDLVKILKLSPAFLESEKQKQLELMKSQQKLFREGKERPSAKDRHVILIDDGIATGATIHAALKSLRNDKPARLTLAVPVAPPSTIANLKKEVDEVVCLHAPEDFQAVGQFYRHFPRLTDEAVVALLKH